MPPIRLPLHHPRPCHPQPPLLPPLLPLLLPPRSFHQKVLAAVFPFAGFGGPHALWTGPPSGGRVVTAAELARHSTRDDCWCAIHGKVYNVTSFLDDHPGGANIMVKYAGKDATRAFDMSAHPMVRARSGPGMSHTRISHVLG